MEGHGWSFTITGLTFQVRKVMGGLVVAYTIIVTLDLGLGFGIRI